MLHFGDCPASRPGFILTLVPSLSVTLSVLPRLGHTHFLNRRAELTRPPSGAFHGRRQGQRVRQVYYTQYHHPVKCRKKKCASLPVHPHGLDPLANVGEEFHKASVTRIAVDFLELLHREAISQTGERWKVIAGAELGNHVVQDFRVIKRRSRKRNPGELRRHGRETESAWFVEIELRTAHCGVFRGGRRE